MFIFKNGSTTALRDKTHVYKDKTYLPTFLSNLKYFSETCVGK